MYFEDRLAKYYVLLKTINEIPPIILQEKKEKDI